MRTPTLSMLALALAGCTGSTFGYSGFNTHDYFAVDGNRSWKYVQEDGSVEWRMEVEKVSPAIETDDFTIHTFEYGIYDPAELLYSIEWSTDALNGIMIHGFAVEGGESVAFSAPLQISEGQMAPGEILEQSVDGYAFVSTFVARETCPNEWVTDDWECLHFTISDGVDDSSSPPFVGDWWFAADWGASRFNLPSYTSDWVLSEASWSAEDE